MHFTVRSSLKITFLVTLILLLLSQYFFISGIYGSFVEEAYADGTTHIFGRSPQFKVYQGDVIYYYSNELPKIGYVAAVPLDFVTLYKGELYINYLGLNDSKFLPKNAFTNSSRRHIGGLQEGDYFVLPNREATITTLNDFIVKEENIKGKALIRLN